MEICDVLLYIMRESCGIHIAARKRAKSQVGLLALNSKPRDQKGKCHNVKALLEGTLKGTDATIKSLSGCGGMGCWHSMCSRLHTTAVAEARAMAGAQCPYVQSCMAGAFLSTHTPSVQDCTVRAFSSTYRPSGTGVHSCVDSLLS